MISADEIPEVLVEWIKENASDIGTNLAAIETAIIIYDGFDSDGDHCWNFLVMSENSVMNIVGLMEVAKLRMMAYQIASVVKEVQAEEELDEDEEN